MKIIAFLFTAFISLQMSGQEKFPDGLYFLRLQDCTVVCHTVIGNGLLLAQCVDVYDFVLSEPVGNRRAVGEFHLPGHLQADKCRK